MAEHGTQRTPSCVATGRLRLHSLHRWSIFVIIARVITDNIAIDSDMRVVHAMEKYVHTSL
jgi:hypothetical protein